MHLANSTKWAIQHMVCKLPPMEPMAQVVNSDILPRDLVDLSLDMEHRALWEQEDIRVEDLPTAPPATTMISVDQVAAAVEI
jgi:hypothetical protein